MRNERVIPIAAISLALALALASALPAAGQQTTVDQTSQPGTHAARPYRGLFGAGSPAAPGATALDLDASVYQEYGNTREGEVPAGSVVLSTGWFLGVRGGLILQRSGQYSRIGLRGEGAFRYYRDTRQATLPRFHVDLGINGTAGRRHQNGIRFSASAAYEPYYILSLFNAAPSVTEETAIVPSSRDDLLFKRARYILGQAFEYEHQFSPRSFLRLSEGARYTKADTPGQDVNSIRVAARFGRRLSQYGALLIGYGYQTGNFGLEARQPIDAHDIDLGVEYRRPLTRSRRTTFGFTSGSSLVTAQPNQRWEIVGSANLRHEFNAGWYIQGDYSRNVQLVEGFANPFFVNTIGASLGGFLGRRVEVFTSGGYSRGVVGFAADPYHAAQGSARMRVALARFLAIDTEGLVNQYVFNNRAAVPATVPPQLSRWAVRCNVALWLPLAR